MSTRAAYDAELNQLKREFGEHLRGLREELGRLQGNEKGFSQEDVAGLSKLHRTQIGNLERGRTDPHMSTLLILADALDVSLDRLVEGLPIPQERRPRTDSRKGALDQ